MLFKRLCLIISLLIVLLCGCSKDTAINSGEQDNNNYSKTEENIFDNDEKKATNQEAQNSNESGNDYGNLINGGYAAYKDGYIYYVNNIDVGKTSDGKLYRVNSDWTEATKILDDKAECINIVGDWIYYINKSDDRKLYKVKKDGTQKTMLYEERCDSIFVQGDWIYYGVSFWANGEVYGELYKMKTDGSSRQKLSDDYSENIVVQDGWIYYLSQIYNSEERVYEDYLHKIKIDGSEKIKLSDEVMYKFILYDKWIYYTNNDSNICKIDVDGNNKSVITKDGVLDFNTDGKWIYYCNLSDYSLYKIKLDGSSKERISKNPSLKIHIVGDWIYYICAYAESSEPYRIKLDGTEEAFIEHPEVVEQQIFECISILNDYIEKHREVSLSYNEASKWAYQFINGFEHFLQDEDSIKLSDEEIENKLPSIFVKETKTSSDSGVNARMFVFHASPLHFGKLNSTTTFIQWWDDNKVNSQILYEMTAVDVSDFMIVEDGGNTSIILIGYVNVYSPRPLCILKLQLKDGVWKEVKAIDDIKADEDIWAIDTSSSMVTIESENMDAIYYEMNKEQTGFKVYLSGDESKKLSFKIVGDRLVQE